LHVLYFQSSAAGSQAYVAEFVQPLTPEFATFLPVAVFEDFCRI
jgi:hypothetical protein